MRFVCFYHSLVSDWNHGNAHFLRGVVTELLAAGHQVEVFEPADAWSRQQLVREHGTEPLYAFGRRFPHLRGRRYRPQDLDLDKALDGADVVLVHEWNAPALIARVGRHRIRGGRYRLLFHDTHHRSVSRPAEIEALDLSGYDGVLAFGEVIRQIYLDRGWAERAWTWHEAADTRVFRPIPAGSERSDLIWVGNWGDGERSREIAEFILEPARSLRLRGVVHGVRYPRQAIAALERTDLAYRGWLPNFEVPRAFARHRVTVHVPRRFYTSELPGIPTIRPFEAMACGIPLICAPWQDTEALFTAGVDYLEARNGAEMTDRLRLVLSDEAYARELGERGRRTILERHTCAHRVEELLDICRRLGVGEATPAVARSTA